MKIIHGLLLLLPVVSCLSAKSAVPEDGNVYFITNKKYYHARVAQWGKNFRDVGTRDSIVGAEQLWVLKEDKHLKEKGEPGWFTIENAHYEGYRITFKSRLIDNTGMTNGHHTEYDLWKFVPTGNHNTPDDGYYYIGNRVYPVCFFKYAIDDKDFNSFGYLNIEHEHWLLTPRFEAELSYVTLWAADNRQGSKDYSEKVTITTGLTLTMSSELSTTVSIASSLEASLGGLGGFSVEMSAEISSTLAHGAEESWSTEREITFTAPAGKNYRVLQQRGTFESLLKSDNCVFGGKYKIEESSDDFTNFTKTITRLETNQKKTIN